MCVCEREKESERVRKNRRGSNRLWVFDVTYIIVSIVLPNDYQSSIKTRFDALAAVVLATSSLRRRGGLSIFGED